MVRGRGGPPHTCFRLHEWVGAVSRVYRLPTAQKHRSTGVESMPSDGALPLRRLQSMMDVLSHLNLDGYDQHNATYAQRPRSLHSSRMRCDPQSAYTLLQGRRRYRASRFDPLHVTGRPFRTHGVSQALIFSCSTRRSWHWAHFCPAAHGDPGTGEGVEPRMQCPGSSFCSCITRRSWHWGRGGAPHAVPSLDWGTA